MKFWTRILLAAGIVLNLSAKAEAGMIFQAVSGGDVEDMEWDFGSVSCLVLLPICLLDGGQQFQRPTTENDLLLNGYSSDEAEIIIKDQTQLALSARTNNVALRISSNGNRNTLHTQILQLHPNASPTFVNYLLERAGY